jgi:amino acid adenylation domain-containing protein
MSASASVSVSVSMSTSVIEDLLDQLIAKSILVTAAKGELSIKAPKGAMTKVLLALLKANKAGLIAYLEGHLQDTVAAPAIEAIARPADGAMVVSFSQQRLWFIDRLQSGSAEYNMPMPLLVEGPFDADAAQCAMNSIVRRHEILRTVFSERGSELVQVICDPVEFMLARHDLSDLDEGAQQGALSQLMASEAAEPFDLAQDLMVRGCFVLLRQADGASQAQQGALLFNMHHIASDGWSMAVLQREFVQHYQAQVSAKSVALAPLKIQYADFAHWQRDYLQGDVLERQLAYWQKQLADLPPVHSVPLDKPRPAQKQFVGAMVQRRLDSQTSENLTQLALRHDLSLFMLLHGALALMLSRHSNSRDIVIGTPVANRKQAELEPLIGFFVNTLALRVNTDQPNLAQYLGHVREVNQDAQSHQDVPFDHLVERLKVPRSVQHTPVFQIMLSMESDFALADGAQKQTIADVSFSALTQDSVAAKFDLLLDIQQSADGLLLRWTYDSSLFVHRHVEQFNDHFERLLLAMTATSAATPLGELPMLSESELAQLRYGMNDTEVEFDHEQRVYQLFEAQVLVQPDAIALSCGNQHMSYVELNRRVNQLAHYLVEQGLKPDGLVGLCLERSPALVVAIMAVLKAGGAYVPLDPDFPQPRLDYMLGDSRPALVLTQLSLAATVSFADIGHVCLDDPALVSQLDGFADHNPQIEGLTSRHLAYVMYTSGSTGQPKGVQIEHLALMNQINWMQKMYPLQPQDKVLQKTPFSFDVSVWEFVWTLAYGAKMVVVKPHGHKDPDYLLSLVVEQQVTVLQFVPSMLAIFLDSVDWSQCDTVRDVFCIGEALPRPLVQAFYETGTTASLHNLYGPTEATIQVSYWPCDDYQALAIIPIGLPMDNIALYVLDPHLQPVPMGVAGELYIGGVGLSRGYLNRAELTAQTFIDCPWQSDSGQDQRLYKSGDLVRYMADGNVEFLGRIDDQVKVRGYRIELKEIELQLTAFAGVTAAVVLVHEDNGQQRLVAYVVADVGGVSEADYISQLQAHLATTLPEYMVPSTVMLLADLPLTANGKLDKKALPQPHHAGQVVFEAPVSEQEVLLAQVWAQVLGLDEGSIGRKDNFFASGGHSLALLRYRLLLKAQGFDIPIAVLYQSQTLAQLALAITAQNSAQNSAHNSAYRDYLKLTTVNPANTHSILF